MTTFKRDGARHEIERHRELKQQGVTSFRARQEIIRLEELRRTDYAAWVRERSRKSVFELIELEGETMAEKLTRGAGAFTQEEVSLCSATPDKHQEGASCLTEDAPSSFTTLLR